MRALRSLPSEFLYLVLLRPLLLRTTRCVPLCSKLSFVLHCFSLLPCLILLQLKRVLPSTRLSSNSAMVSISRRTCGRSRVRRWMSFEATGNMGCLPVRRVRLLHSLGRRVAPASLTRTAHSHYCSRLHCWAPRWHTPQQWHTEGHSSCCRRRPAMP